MRREVFLDVGGMNTDLPANYNDVDLSMTVRHAGYRILWTPEASWYHFESRSFAHPIDPAETALHRAAMGCGRCTSTPTRTRTSPRVATTGSNSRTDRVRRRTKTCPTAADPGADGPQSRRLTARATRRVWSVTRDRPGWRTSASFVLEPPGPEADRHVDRPHLGSECRVDVEQHVAARSVCESDGRRSDATSTQVRSSSPSST